MFPGQCWLWAPASCSVCRGRTKCRLTQRGGGCSAGASGRAGRAASAQLCSWTRCQLWHSCCRSLQRDVLCGLSLFPFVVAGVPVRASVKSRGQGRHCCTLNQLRSSMGDEFFLPQRAGLFRSGYLGFFTCWIWIFPFKELFCAHQSEVSEIQSQVCEMLRKKC